MFGRQQGETTQDFKRRRDRLAVETAQRVDARFPAGLVRDGVPGREPDFIIDGLGGPLGVEVTEYFRPNFHTKVSVGAQETFTEKVTRTMALACARAGLSHVSASITFDFLVHLKQKDLDRLSNWAVDFLGPVARERRSINGQQCGTRLPSGISDAWAYWRPWDSPVFIAPSWGGMVPIANEECIRERVRAKEAKLGDIYLTHCSVVWLLLLVDPYQVATMGYVRPEFQLEHSEFDRVIALQSWTETRHLWCAERNQQG